MILVFFFLPSLPAEYVCVYVSLRLNAKLAGCLWRFVQKQEHLCSWPPICQGTTASLLPQSRMLFSSNQCSDVFLRRIKLLQTSMLQFVFKLPQSTEL
jgi:hypothetical protein